MSKSTITQADFVPLHGGYGLYAPTGEVVDLRGLPNQDEFGAADEDFGDDDFEGDDFEGDDEFGARGRGKGKGNRGTKNWVAAILGGNQTLGGAGPAVVTIRTQHDFLAEDISFDGTVAGSNVTSIMFGPDLVWSSPTGISTTLFNSTSFVRGLLGGHRLKAGLDIQISGNAGGAGLYQAALIGKKPRKS